MRMTWLGRVARHAFRAFGGALGVTANLLALLAFLVLPTVAALDLVPVWVAAAVTPTIAGTFAIIGAYRVAEEDRMQITSLTKQVLASAPQPPLSEASPPVHVAPAPPVSRSTGVHMSGITSRSNGIGIHVGQGVSLVATDVLTEGNAGPGIYVEGDES